MIKNYITLLPDEVISKIIRIAIVLNLKNYVKMSVHIRKQKHILKKIIEKTINTKQMQWVGLLIIFIDF